MKAETENNEREFENLKKIFEDDIQNLLELTFPNGPVQERHVRQASVIVRRWLCDNELNKLNSYMRSTITFPVLKDKDVLDQASMDPDVDYYLSAGVKFDGKPIWALYHSNSEEAPNWLAMLQGLDVEDTKLSKALKRPVLFFDDSVFTMDEVLRFACNKLGGAHLDSSRDEKTQKLDDAHRYLTFGPPEEAMGGKNIGQIHLPLERHGKEILSGISVIVIVAAAMIINIRFNDVPFIQLASEEPKFLTRVLRGFKRLF